MQNELEYVGLGLYWNDLTVGQKFRTINRTVTETDLVNFINATGMVEVMFTDATFGDAHGAVKGRPVHSQPLVIPSTLPWISMTSRES